jgi:hypothetical protein
MEGGMHGGWEKFMSKPGVCGALVVFASVFALPSDAATANRSTPPPVTLRCTLHYAGSDDSIIQYFLIDSEQRTVSASGELYRIGADPSGQTGKVITRWSDTEITLVNEEWIRNGWQRFRIVTVLDRLTGAIRSEDLNSTQSGNCTIADVGKKLF